MGACEKELKPVPVVVVDPVRHYYPVLQGENMGVTFEIENIGSTPLFIQEVQATCGCLIPRDQMPIVVLPQKSGFVHLDFNTIKNTGYVHHYVYCYGNFRDSDYIRMSFDTNVVPSADYIRDYEQLWNDQIHHKGTMREYVDGRTSQKGYYTSEDEGNIRQRKQKEIQKEVDEAAP